jgi:hypothetical protein
MPAGKTYLSFLKKGGKNSGTNYKRTPTNYAAKV